jgi:hypothetical protein
MMSVVTRYSQFRSISKMLIVPFKVPLEVSFFWLIHFFIHFSLYGYQAHVDKYRLLKLWSLLILLLHSFMCPVLPPLRKQTRITSTILVSASSLMIAKAHFTDFISLFLSLYCLRYYDSGHDCHADNAFYFARSTSRALDASFQYHLYHFIATF